MIGPGFYPLAWGFGITAALVLYADLKAGHFHAAMLAPALIGILAFYQGLPLSFLLLPTLTGAALVLTTYGVLFAFSQFWKKWKNQESVIGAEGDYLMIFTFAFWPEVVLVTLPLALALGVLGSKMRLKGAVVQFWNKGNKGVPLAGLMSLFCLMYIGWLAVL